MHISVVLIVNNSNEHFKTLMPNFNGLFRQKKYSSALLLLYVVFVLMFCPAGNQIIAWLDTPLVELYKILFTCCGNEDIIHDLLKLIKVQSVGSWDLNIISLSSHYIHPF